MHIFGPVFVCVHMYMRSTSGGVSYTDDYEQLCWLTTWKSAGNLL